MKEQLAGQSCFCSWSGGKDSSLALYRAIKAGVRPELLVTLLYNPIVAARQQLFIALISARALTVMNELGERSRSHALPPEVIAAQGEALGLPTLVRAASWQDYERELLSVLQGLPSTGIRIGVFGDIDLEEHADWEHQICARAGLQAWLPLWQQPRELLLTELLDLGFKATIVSLRADLLDRRFLGRVLDQALITELIAAGVDPSGENGEYHTVVTDGPIFQSPLQLRWGEQELHSGYWFQNVTL